MYGPHPGPLPEGEGTIYGPHPRPFSRKATRTALTLALSRKAAQTALTPNPSPAYGRGENATA